MSYWLPVQAVETASVSRRDRDRFPPQIPFIVGNEACERFSFYGMVGILALYVKNHLGQGEARASEISHLFKAGVYFMPLFGAWLSDTILGRYRTILYISFLYCAGHGVLALSDLTASVDIKLDLLYFGLVLLSIGGGGIKPCVSAFVGDQFREDQNHLLQKAYGLFYWSINFGSFFAFLIIPQIAERHGYGWAFGVPGIAMGLATLVFWLGRAHYKHVPPTRGSGGGNYWAMLWHALFHGSERRPGYGFWDSCRSQFTAEQIEGARCATRVLGVFALFPFFWALWDQTNSTWVIQGEKMLPYPFPEAVRNAWYWPVVHFIAGDKIGAEQMQSMNAIQVMVVVPLFTYLVYPAIEKMGVRITTLRRMSIGLFIAALSFMIVAVIQTRIDAGIQMTVLWQSWQYLVLTVAEVLVSNTALEFAFREAPAAMRSTLMSFWLLTIAAGNLGVSRVFHLNVKERLKDGTEILYISGTHQFELFAALMFLVAIVFVLVASRYHYREEQVGQGKLST